MADAAPSQASRIRSEEYQLSTKTSPSLFETHRRANSSLRLTKLEVRRGCSIASCPHNVAWSIWEKEMKEARLVNVAALCAVFVVLLLASCVEAPIHTLDSAAEPTPAEVAADSSKECPGAVGLRSECQRKQTARLEACAQTPETERAGCEHDAQFLMEACGDLPESPTGLFCGVGSNAKCPNRVALTTDSVGAKFCAGGTMCTTPGTVCTKGIIFDCKCTSVWKKRTGQCACECVH
jgi:hypothetical protein